MMQRTMRRTAGRPPQPACHAVPLFLVFLAILAALCQPLFGFAEGFSLTSAALRGGFSASDNDEYFHQYEITVAAFLPWTRPLPGDLVLGTRLDGSAGVMNGGGDRGFVASLGPTFTVTSPGGVFVLEAGIGPTLLGEDEYGDEDFGGPVQFTSHLGCRYRATEHLSLGYRIQHMSNAGLYRENPGLNLHMIEVRYHF